MNASPPRKLRVTETCTYEIDCPADVTTEEEAEDFWCDLESIELHFTGCIEREFEIIQNE